MKSYKFDNLDYFKTLRYVQTYEKWGNNFDLEFGKPCNQKLG